MTPAVSNRPFAAAVGAMLLALFFWAVVPLMLVHFTRWMDP